MLLGWKICLAGRRSVWDSCCSRPGQKSPLAGFPLYILEPGQALLVLDIRLLHVRLLIQMLACSCSAACFAHVHADSET